MGFSTILDLDRALACLIQVTELFIEKLVHALRHKIQYQISCIHEILRNKIEKQDS